ncbi:synphilin-1 [Denticeps clupeoides]|uniref:Synphilin-1 alpha-Synuclein-binding domain-containing protein n=1 Tax=Denticeps clupeoides TaxID=299321 RepID=A0AAY4D3T6_9TELE|nr:synphilin-1 [Denticeps clupeoides]
MDAPEYLDLDEIDFSDDLPQYSSKNIPELCRRNEGPSEERQVPGINWSRGVSHGGSGIKPTGIADVYSKFRPVKRVSPLKHQPEVPDGETEGKSPGRNGEAGREEPSAKPGQAGMPGSGDSHGLKHKMLGNAVLFGELEHYDLDMDEILDVPYIKSSQQMATLPRANSDKRPMASSVGLGGATSERCQGLVKSSGLPHPDSHAIGPQYCVLSPVKWPDMRKSKSMDAEFQRSQTGAFELVASGPLHCSNASDMDKHPALRTHPEVQKAGGEGPGSQPLMFPPPAGAGSRQDAGRNWGSSRLYGECDEETKKTQNIINIVREGQISLLPHLAADNLELIRDEDGNNLLHISASHGHADCLQHLTTLMGEDCLNERNHEQLTPAGLGVKNGRLECVRWMVSETEAIAELSCSRDHPSLIHYAARYGQEKILLWLLQFMQEQAISLDEVDQLGNSAVHVAAQYGHLGCIQTLVEYGSNVTVQNQQGERPSQSAERHGHTTCSRYLVVVETCMSLASQVVKLTKQLHEQTTARVTLQNQMQQLLKSAQPDGGPVPSASTLVPPAESWPEMMLTAEVAPGDGQWVLRQRSMESDAVLRKLLGKDIAERMGARERLTLEFQDGDRSEGAMGGDHGAVRRMGVVEKRELKLARLKQIMQRSLSESDGDAYPPDETKHGAARPERPNQLPLSESVDPPSTGPHLLMKKQHSSTAERKFSFANRTSRSVDGYNPSPTSDNSDPDHDPIAGRSDPSGELPDTNSSQKVTTSPKSALKSPSSRRKTSQNLKLRVTFDEAVVHKEGQEPEARGGGAKDGEKGGARASESGDSWKRPFGTFRSIMETLSGNQNSNNNHIHAATKQAGSGSTPSKKAEGKAGVTKGKNKSSAV